MSFLTEIEEITTMRDLGDAVEVNTTIRSHTVPKKAIKFMIASELQIPFFQNSGANTICYSTWSQIQDLLNANGIMLPESISPCHTCDGSKCMFWCPKH